MIESAPGNQTDVILGGGMLSFKNGSNSNPKWVCSRQDGRDLIKGYKIDYFNLKFLIFNLIFWNPQYPLLGRKWSKMKMYPLPMSSKLIYISGYEDFIFSKVSNNL